MHIIQILHMHVCLLICGQVIPGMQTINAASVVVVALPAVVMAATKKLLENVKIFQEKTWMETTVLSMKKMIRVSFREFMEMKRRAGMQAKLAATVVEDPPPEK